MRGLLRLKQAAKTSKAAAVKLFCVECMGGQDGDRVTDDIRQCTATGCPLYPWRPYRTSKAAT
jgi:hypothetical protein